MGDTISQLVFRPPNPPTPIRPNKHFWLDIDRDGNKVPAFFIKRRKATVTCLFSHGNAEDLGMMYSRMKELARVMCVNVMAYDYTGYGKSTGEANEENVFKCISAAYKYLLDIRGIKPEEIVLYGRSVGSGPTCYLAARTADEGRPVAGVILHSPFLSIFRVVVDLGFSISGDMFRNIEHVPKIKCPVFIIHGTEDEVVPFWHGQELLRNIPVQYRANPYFAEGLGHNNIEVRNKDEYVLRVSDFLHRYVSAMRKNIDCFDERDKDGNDSIKVLEIPEEERCNKIEGIEKKWLNKTWVAHGMNIMNSAFGKDKGGSNKRKDAKSPDSNQETVSTAIQKKPEFELEPFEEFEVVPFPKLMEARKAARMSSFVSEDTISTKTTDLLQQRDESNSSSEERGSDEDRNGNKEIRCNLSNVKPALSSDEQTNTSKSTESEVRSRCDMTSMEVVLNFERYV